MEVERVNIDAEDIKKLNFFFLEITPGFDLRTQLACYTSSEDTGLEQQKPTSQLLSRGLSVSRRMHLPFWRSETVKTLIFVTV